MTGWWQAAMLVLGLVLVATGAGADDIYRSVDAAGRSVYSNIPTENAERSDAAVESATAQGGTPAPAEADQGFTTSASLRRQSLERELRDADRRLRDIDAQLASLARVRTRNAAGSAATGGVRASAADVTTDDERVLGAEREQVRQHVSELRESYAKLRDEVTAKVGAVPDWWVDLR